MKYHQILCKALSEGTSKGRNINMLLHLFGYFSKELSKEEKAFFLDNLSMYESDKVPFTLPLSIIESWAIRFDNKYLLRQKIFNIFPIDLIDLMDSKKYK